MSKTSTFTRAGLTIVHLLAEAVADKTQAVKNFYRSIQSYSFDGVTFVKGYCKATDTNDSEDNSTWNKGMKAAKCTSKQLAEELGFYVKPVKTPKAKKEKTPKIEKSAKVGKNAKLAKIEKVVKTSKKLVKVS